jgi:hypothetical protein
MMQINYRDVLGSAVRSQLGAINAGIRSSGSRPSENVSSFLPTSSQGAASRRGDDLLSRFFGGVFNTGSSSGSRGSGSISNFYRDMAAAGRDFKNTPTRGIERSQIHMPKAATDKKTPDVKFQNAPNAFNFQHQTPTMASARTLPPPSNSTQSGQAGTSVVSPQQQAPTVLSARAGSPTLQLQANPSQVSVPGQGGLST